MTEKEWGDLVDDIFDNCERLHRALNKYFENIKAVPIPPGETLKMSVLFKDIHNQLNRNFHL